MYRYSLAFLALAALAAPASAQWYDDAPKPRILMQGGDTELSGGPTGTAPTTMASQAQTLDIEAAKHLPAGLTIHRGGEVSYTEPGPVYARRTVVNGQTGQGSVALAKPLAVTVGDTLIVHAPHAFRPYTPPKSLK